MTRVLIVDDNRDVRDALCAVLEAEGYEVATAADGAQALLQVTATRPDLVVLDIHMPVLDGWGCGERLHAEAPDLPFVYLSAGPLDRARARATGAVAAHDKMDIDGLLGTVELLTRRAA
jgi:CheY-like chemotaxis protein